jgi:exosortase A-associated hydrolase 2
LKSRLSGHFVKGQAGPLAVVLWEPPAPQLVRFAVLHVPAFGEEMNKSRRMVAVQARSLAALGGAVAVLDPRGTGDSAGEHKDAAWDGWRFDVRVAWEWLAARVPVPGLLWGLRLGGLLAADLVSQQMISPAALLLWQPVVSGRSFFNQWLRQAKAQRITRQDAPGGHAPGAASGGDPQLTEVAGYGVHTDLIAAAQAIDLNSAVPGHCRVIWREVTIANPPALSLAAAKVTAGWTAAGVVVDALAVTGASFWASQEIEEAPELVSATTQAVHAAFADDAVHAP